MKQITSFQNPLIKKILLLQEKSKYRKEENLFIIDGWKETQMAIANGFEIDAILFRKGFGLNFDELDNEKVIEISEDVFDRISYRGNTSKVVSVVKQKSHSLGDLTTAVNALILILDGIEKPGNLGAILRTADAAGVTAVICCDTQTDIYNPNVVRSSVGCLFTQQIAITPKEECLAFLQNNKIDVYTTSLKAAKNYLECNYTKPAAFVFGTEATGVDTFWETHASQNIIIPMRGQNDSLNVSNAVAIVLFEALRQRN
ncbi:MAG: RNA methyltransferase [Chitinophagales bacterium]